MKKSIIAFVIAILYLVSMGISVLASFEYNFQDYVGSGRIDDKDDVGEDVDLSEPYGIFEHQTHGIMFLDSQNNKIKIVKDGEVKTFSGNYLGTDEYYLPIGGYKDGNLSEARFNKPRQGVVDKEGNIYIADSENHIIRKIVGDRVYTLAGNGKPGYKDGKANEAQFNLPIGLAIDKDGYLYVADTLNNVIRRVDKGGNVETFAGIYSEVGGFKNGIRDKALFNEPNDIVIDKDCNLYISDSGNNLIRIIKNDHVRTFAGTNLEANVDDGYKLNTKLKNPKGLYLNEDGVLLIADTGNNEIKAIGKNGKVYSVAKNNLSPSDVLYPSDVLLVGDIIYVTDTFNHKIKKINMDLLDMYLGINKMDYFEDVVEKSWFYDCVMDLYLEGRVKGYYVDQKKYFKPQKSVTVDEFITMSLSSIGYSGIELSENYWAENIIHMAKSLNIIKEGEFKNYRAPIIRQEMMMIISRIINSESKNENTEYKDKIMDFEDVGEYYKDDVAEVFSKGIVVGYTDGSIKPKNTLTRAEATVVINKTLKYFDNVLK